MTNSATVNGTGEGVWRPRDLAGWLALAASPSFALMAGLTGIDAGPLALCSAASSFPPIHGMTVMYLSMSLFHLSPWLKLAGRRSWASH